MIIITTMLSLTKSLFIEPKHLIVNNNYIKQHIFSRLKEKYEHTCNKKFGFILQINTIDSISDITINYKGYGIVTVTFSINYIKPIVNESITSYIISIHSHGILSIPNQIQTLQLKKPPIPIWIGSSQLKNCGYVYTNGEYIHKTLPVIQKESVVNINITHIMYKQNIYNCLGKLDLKNEKK